MIRLTFSKPDNSRTLVTATSLAAALASVPDPRRDASVIYPLPAVLSLAVVAILCAHTPVLAMAECSSWGAPVRANQIDSRPLDSPLESPAPVPEQAT